VERVLPLAVTGQVVVVVLLLSGVSAGGAVSFWLSDHLGWARGNSWVWAWLPELRKLVNPQPAV
jgi:hypothetical protein